ARLEPLPLLDLPGVGVEVSDERLRVVELQGRAREKPLRPRLFPQESHGRLVAVKSHADLRLPDERAGPLRLVSARARRLPPAGLKRLRHVAHSASIRTRSLPRVPLRRCD